MPRPMPVFLVPRPFQKVKSRRCCCVPGCMSVQSKDVDVSFHRFPTELYRRKLWVYALGLEENHPANTLVCSRHFTKESFVEPSVTFRSLARRKLHGNAIPSLFVPPNRTPLIPVAFNPTFIRLPNTAVNMEPKTNVTQNDTVLSSEHASVASTVTFLIQQCEAMKRKLQQLEKLQTSSSSDLQKLAKLLQR